MKIKVTFLLAVLIVGLIYMSATVKFEDIVVDASANNDKCEDDHTCYVAYHIGQPYQKDQCRHNENSQWKFYQPLQECGGGEEDPTKVPKEDTPVVIKITSTSPPPEPPTAEPEDPPTALPTALPTATDMDPGKEPDPPKPTSTLDLFRNNKSTPTSTSTPIPAQEQTEECNLCNVMETIGAGVATMAEAASKGD